MGCDALNKCRLALGVGDPVVWVSGGQLNLELFVGAGGLRVRDEVIAKE